MEMENMDGFSPISSTPVLWKSRKRPGSFKSVKSTTNIDGGNNAAVKLELGAKDNFEIGCENHSESSSAEGRKLEEDPVINVVLSEKRKALFEPLEPVHNVNGKRPSAASLLPPPDFEAACYPRGWLIGKKRKLVNVDVVEGMRRIAVQEMNRKARDRHPRVRAHVGEGSDREIDGLNEQLEEDARCLEHLQLQLLEERSKRADAERENTMLQNQLNMLMDMIQENEAMDDDDGAPGEP